MLVALTMYVRYRQLAEYLSARGSPHPARVNKASFAIGMIIVFGMTVVADFPVCEPGAQEVPGSGHLL